jgi:hypothetical protein
MPAAEPSGHLAVVDSCVGCHARVPTSAQAALGQDVNHAFKVDTTLCAACHSALVDGEGLKAANAAQLTDLLRLVFAKTQAAITAAVNYVPPTGVMMVGVRAYDPATNSYSTSSSTLTPAGAGLVVLAPGNAPTSVGLYRSSSGINYLLLTLPNSVTWLPTAAGAQPITTNTLMVSTSGFITNQVVTPTTPSWPTTAYYSPLTFPAPKSGTYTTPYPASPNPPPWLGAAGFANTQVLFKAYWNWATLNLDGTLGIHNPRFFADVVANTVTRLNALP